MKIEVCCGSYCDALAAWEGGASRVELCSALFFGGLTPSLGALQLLKEKTGLEVATMVRPREGGFCYSDDEFAWMLRDGELLIQNGADALVFGFLTMDGKIDEEKTKAMIEMVNGRCQTVFHKAFDVSTTPLMEGMEILHHLGVSRILTSGREKTALDGADAIKSMIDTGWMEILPAGSIRAYNIQELYNRTGCQYVHTSAFAQHFDHSGKSESVFFTGKTPPAQGEYSLVDKEVVRNIVKVGSMLL